MNQKSQSNILMGIVGLTAIVILGYLGFDYLSGKKPAAEAAAAVSNATAAAINPTATGTDASSAISAAVASATSAATDGANSAGLSADEARKIGEEVARQVATQVAQSIVDQQLAKGGAAASSGGGMTEAEARRIGQEEGRRVAQEVATTTIQQAMAGKSSAGGSALSAAEAEQIGYAAGKRAAEKVAARTAREVVRNEFGSKAAVASSASEASAVPARAPKSAVSGQVSVASNDAASSVRHPAAADALKAWWTPPATDGFGLLYAGQPKGESAIALLFTQKPGDGSLSQGVKVYDAKGQLVSGQWEPATNPKLAVLRGVKPGRYTVVLAPTVVDANGKTMEKPQHGPVYVI